MFRTPEAAFVVCAIVALAAIALAEDWRARWALLVALHGLGGSQVAGAPVNISPSWPFPDSAQILVRQEEVATRVYARIPGSRVCVETADFPLSRDTPPGEWRGCRHIAPDERRYSFAQPERASRRSVRPLPAAPMGNWTQYLPNVEKTGAEFSDTKSRSWSASLPADARSSPSVSGGLAFVGTHGAAASKRFRWGMSGERSVVEWPRAARCLLAGVLNVTSMELATRLPGRVSPASASRCAASEPVRCDGRVASTSFGVQSCDIRQALRSATRA